MLPSARLGFHQPAFRGMTAADRSAAIATEQLAAAGIRIEQRIRSAGNQRLAERHVVSRQGRTRPGARGNARDFVHSGKPGRQAGCRYIVAGAGGTDMPLARVTVPTAARSAPAAGIASNGDPTGSTGAATYGPVRNSIPADLLKRLSTPRKTAVIPLQARRRNSGRLSGEGACPKQKQPGHSTRPFKNSSSLNPISTKTSARLRRRCCRCRLFSIWRFSSSARGESSAAWLDHERIEAAAMIN